MKTVILTFIFTALGVWGFWILTRLPVPFRDRPCQGKRWRLAFPNASKSEIRSFLSLFMQAFALRNSKRQRLKLRPEDLVLDVYRGLYPPKWPDNLELETLAEDVRRVYEVELEEIWSEGLTIGELFAGCLASRESG